jgi:hypothetical protein
MRGALGATRPGHCFRDAHLHGSLLRQAVHALLDELVEVGHAGRDAHRGQGAVEDRAQALLAAQLAGLDPRDLRADLGLQVGIGLADPMEGACGEAPDLRQPALLFGPGLLELVAELVGADRAGPVDGRLFRHRVAARVTGLRRVEGLVGRDSLLDAQGPDRS